MKFCFGLQEILSGLRVSLGTSKTKFSAALSSKSEIAVEGVVKGGKDAFITKVGRFDVDLSVEGIVILVRQRDQPGIIAGAALCLPCTIPIWQSVSWVCLCSVKISQDWGLDYFHPVPCSQGEEDTR